MERQFHCHDHVPGSSCALDGTAAVCGDFSAGVAGSPPTLAVVEDGAADGVVVLTLLGAVETDDGAEAATFTCVTLPSSPGLPTRTLTFTLLDDACTALTGVVAGGGGAAVATGAGGGSVAISLVVSP